MSGAPGMGFDARTSALPHGFVHTTGPGQAADPTARLPGLT
ncbi:hypothetical protein [Saccharopolyspora sp. 5N708]